MHTPCFFRRPDARSSATSSRTVVSVIGLLRLAGRIYAGALLRIGRRVRLREAWRGAEG